MRHCRLYEDGEFNAEAVDAVAALATKIEKGPWSVLGRLSVQWLGDDCRCNGWPWSVLLALRHCTCHLLSGCYLMGTRSLAEHFRW